MYDYKDYNSLVIDKVSDVSKHEECQWYKQGHYLYNAKHKTCIAKTDDIEKMTQLAGYSNDGMECARYTEELTFDRLRRTLVKKSGTS